MTSPEGGDPGDLSLSPSEKDAKSVLGTAEDVSKVKGRAPVGVEGEKDRVDLTLQRFVGYGGLGLMLVQFLVANFVFLKYAHEVGWDKLSAGVLQVFFAATVVQVIGVVLVIARSVFPEGGRKK